MIAWVRHYWMPLAIGAGVAALVALSVWCAAVSEAGWRRFAQEHNCRVVARES